MVNWVAVSIFNKEIYDRELYGDFITYKLLIRNKLLLYSMSVVSQFVIWLFGFHGGHIRELMRVMSGLVFRMPCLKQFTKTTPPLVVWLPKSHISVVVGWFGTSDPFQPGPQAVCLTSCPCDEGQLLPWSRGTGGAEVVCHFLIHLFSSLWVAVEDERDWGVGSVSQSWAPCSLPVRGR